MKNQMIYKVLIGVLIILFSLGAVSNLLQLPDAMKSIETLGYPNYFSYILGMAQLLAVLILIAPKLYIIKEWALIGMIINLLGALLSHFVVKCFTSVILIILLIIGVVITALEMRWTSQNNQNQK